MSGIISTATAVGLAACMALTLGSAAHAQKVARESAAAPQAARGLLTGTVAPRVQQRADGSQEIESDESMLNTSVLVRRADGSMARFCAPNAEIARRLASGQRTSFAKNMQELANER